MALGVYRMIDDHPRPVIAPLFRRGFVDFVELHLPSSQGSTTAQVIALSGRFGSHAGSDLCGP